MRVWQSRNQDIWVWGKFCWGFQFANMVWRWFWVPLFHWVALDPRFPHVSEPGRHIKIHQSKQIKTVWVKWIEKLLQRQDTVGFPIFFFLTLVVLPWCLCQWPLHSTCVFVVECLSWSFWDPGEASMMDPSGGSNGWLQSMSLVIPQHKSCVRSELITKDQQLKMNMAGTCQSKVGPIPSICSNWHLSTDTNSPTTYIKTLKKKTEHIVATKTDTKTFHTPFKTMSKTFRKRSGKPPKTTPKNHQQKK